LFAVNIHKRYAILYAAVAVPSLDTAIQVAAVAMVVMHPLFKAVGKQLFQLSLILVTYLFQSMK
jgi:hypothetical protein